MTADLLNKMICVDGIVTRASNVAPKLVCSVHYCAAKDTIVVRQTPDKMGYTTPLEIGTGAPKQDKDGNPFGLLTACSLSLASAQTMFLF